MSDNPLESEDLIAFLEEGETQTPPPTHPWLALIVDDDDEVHQATSFAIGDILIDGRSIQLLHAYSATECRTILQNTPDVALTLLDVVMETEDAGLRLVKIIRQELGLSAIRIILRTGQPGYAPELEVIRDYDINDYKTKTDLTRTRLITAITTAVRSYEQIRIINNNRRGLELIIQSSNDLFNHRALKSFSAGVLIQIAALVGLEPDGLLCAQPRPENPNSEEETGLYIVAATGKYEALVDHPLEEVPDPLIVEGMQQCLANKQILYLPQATFLI